MSDVLRIGVEPESVEVTPGGAPVVVKVRVFNGTAIIDEFHVSAIGVGQWLSAAPASVRLFPDKEDSVDLTLAIPPGQFVPAGARTVGIQVTSASNPALVETRQIQVTVGAVAAEVTLTVQPQIVRGGKRAELAATVQNAGNTPLAIALTGQDAEGVVRFDFTPPRLDIPPGGQASARVVARAPRAFFGTETQRQLTIRGEGGATPLVANATFLQAPAFTTGSLRWLRTLVTLLAAALMVAGAFATWVTVQLLGSANGVELDYQGYSFIAFDAVPPLPEDEQLADLASFFGSAGFVTLFFAAFVALGVLTESGKMTRVAGALCLVVILALFAVLFVIPNDVPPPTIGLGAILAAAGSILAIVGGSIGT